MYIKKIKIGNVELENNILLAPMAGITDLPFRLITRKYGKPGLVCTEMVSAKAIFYNDEKTKKLLDMKGEKRPVAVQIFGSEIESLVYAAKYVEKLADIIDINMGCPAPKVVKNGDGSKLLLNLDLAQSIVSEVVKAVKKPVTVKYRKGWNSSNIVAVEAAKRFQDAGASAITIHGRTREEFYSGKADLDIIRKVKESVSIPVIGNGDVIDTKSAKEMFDYTGVDAIMIGRASIGNPWIFNKIIKELNEIRKEELESILDINKIGYKERLNVIIEHLELEIAQKGEITGIREMRKHISAYTKNLPDSSIFRNEMNKIDKKDALLDFIREYFRMLELV